MQAMQEPRIPGVQLGVELGRGAHSIVYRGEHECGSCAVKVPRTRARWTRWIHREAVALARVRHSGLPTVFEVGVVDDLPFLVMELVEGKTLADRLEDGQPLPVEEVLAIARQLASVLAAVHEVGLVHRDVKPRNIVIDENGTLKLVDFGFTTPMERTGTGETAGTAAYAAPEQFVPPGRVDERSDLYCVGRVLFECLLGADFPADRNGPYGRDAYEELAEREVPLDLATIIADLLREDMDARYPDARALESELKLIRLGLRVLGASSYPHERTRPPTVARAAELQLVLDAVHAQKGGSVVLIHGARGSGKSLLLDTIEHRLSRIEWSARIRCLQDDPPLATLRRILERSWSEMASDGFTTAELRQILGNLDRVAALISRRLATAFGLDDALGATDVREAADALAEGAAEIVIRLARWHGRTLLIIDDLHWMDAASAEALARVAHRVSEIDLTVILASRSDGTRGVLERFLVLQQVEVPITEVPLARLREDAVAALVGSYLSAAAVDPLLVGRIHAMSDGTPLGVLEVLNAFLDSGALRPHARDWRFDPKLLEAASLPSNTLALLGRRLAEIPPATRRILEVAAVCGASFTETRIAAILDVTPDTIGYGTVTAQRAGVIEPIAGDGYRFVHDSLRETLLDEMPESMCRELHQQAGELLADQADPSFEDLCEAARHFSAGVQERNPPLVYRVASMAAKLSVERFDDEAALGFVAQAAAAAELAHIDPSSDFHRVAGEAFLRLASVPESIEAFKRALAVAKTPLERAALYGRISWAHKTESEPEKAWQALDRAFAELGERLPVEDAASTASTTAQLTRAQLIRFRERRVARPVAETDLLCQLHFQNGRLAWEYGKAMRIVQSSLVANALSAEADSLAVRARARGVHACTVSIFGRPAAGIRQATEALELAKRSGDLTAAALCTQMVAMTGIIAGELERGSRAFRELVDVYGPWMDLHEYTLNVMSGEMISTAQGRPVDSWAWLEHAAARARRSRVSPRTLLTFVHRARATLASLDREPEPGSWLAQQFERISISDGGRGYEKLSSWGTRAMYFLHRGDFGPDFEALVREFEREKLNPRTANIVVGEFYVALGHARLQQCLTTSGPERTKHIRALAKATADVQVAARTNFVKAHARLLQGAHAWLKGSTSKAEKLLAEAEMRATRDGVVWVLSDIARIRAHMLRAAGKDSAARDQSRIAESIARQHGAASRSRVLRRELDLPANDFPSADPARRSSRRSSRTARQLAVLLHVARGARRDLKTEQLAATTLDELLVTLGAERAAIWFQPEVPSLGTAVARHRNNASSIAITPESPLGALLRGVHRVGRPWPGATPVDTGVSFAEFDPTRMLVVPLHLYEQPVGALSMERAASEPEFGAEDAQLLEMLAHQVPIALEIARLLSERERLHASLQQAQKLEAIGQLAGGLAHDFNNMLAAMKVALGIAQERAGDDQEMRAELDIIGQATTRAAQLTSQLLSFSRSQPLPLRVHDVNQLILALEPMLRRVATARVTLKLSLSPIVDAVLLDAASFDQALMNLMINARDAMPNGGSFTVSTRNIQLDETAALHANVPPGFYVEIQVADTGEGMSADTRSRIFEPFFTTKPVGRGTGLGLATVWGFVRNVGGGIEVWSEPGKGTRFTLYLKRTERPRSSRHRSSSSSSSSISTSSSTPSATTSSLIPPSNSIDTILVVDDDDLVRRSIAKILERNGYRVLAASGAAEALDVACSLQSKRIGLVIMDVLLPGTTGPELYRRLKDLMAAKILFVSGFSAESSMMEEAEVTADMLLQKPFTQSALLERVRELLASAADEEEEDEPYEAPEASEASEIPEAAEASEAPEANE